MRGGKGGVGGEGGYKGSRECELFPSKKQKKE
jgi:hypothetical protein